MNQNQNNHIRRRLRSLNKRHFTNENGQLNFKKIFTYTALFLGGGFILAVLFFAAAIAVLSIGLPDVRDLDNLAVAQSTTIYDREGNILYVKYGEENREYKSLAQISQTLIDATLATEDDQFYNHPGFDMFGFTRAALSNITGGTSQGGSTITQQYIKLTFLTSEKSYIRKLKELILAVRIEESFDKDTILEKYLNKIPYGNNAFGIEKAAQIYFDKSARDLNLAESAVLAAIPQAPSYYNPYGPNKFSKLSADASLEDLIRKNVKTENDLKDYETKRGLIGQFTDIGENKVYLPGRSDIVLRRMVETGKITEEEKKEALEQIRQLQFNEYRQSIKAPHFVLDVIQDLEKKYGKEVVEKGGLKVYTTIDPKLQEIAEEAISSRSEKYEQNYNVKNSALVSLNPNNGQILAMVGSRNYFDEKIDGKLNIVTSFRQPGSTFKPLVYAAAFLNRYSPASVVFDIPTPFGSAWPKNYDGQFLGPITIREALGKSRNIPAIKAYFLAGEQDKILELAKKMGVNFMNEDLDYGYPLSLGSAETTLLSMTTAFGTFANGGLKYEPVSILRVENSEGQILEEWEDKMGEEALDPQIAYLITSILSDKNVRVGPNLTVSGQINAGKTGTSNRKNGSQYLPHDLLTIGYTTNLVTGVWAGNNDDRKDGTLSPSADGYSVAAPIFKEFMEKSLENVPSEEFPMPTGIQQVTVSKFSGKLVSDLTPLDQQVTDFFASFAVPTEVDSSYAGIADFTASDNLGNTSCRGGQSQRKNTVVLHAIDPAREVWENAVQEWLKEHTEFMLDQSGSISCETATNTPTIKIKNLEDNQYIADSFYTVEIDAKSDSAIKKALFYLDGTLQYNQDQAPFSGNIRLPGGTSKKTHELTILVYDSNGNIGEKTISIKTSRNTNNDEPTNDTTPSADTLPTEDGSSNNTPPVTVTETNSSSSDNPSNDL